MSCDRRIDRHQAVRRPAEWRAPVEAGNLPGVADVADVQDYAAAIPVADIEPVTAADRVMAAMPATTPAWRLTARGPLPGHPPAANLPRMRRIGQIENHDDVADIAFDFRRDVGVASVEGEPVHAHPAATPLADL